MSTPYNIPTIIGIADISMYLAQDAIFKSALFRKPPFSPILPEIIYVENDTLRYLYDASVAGTFTQAQDDEMDSVANYVFSLCVYTLRAYNIYANGNGGTLVPITPGTHMPLPYDFEVNGISSFIVDGVSSTTITLFIGYNIEFVRNGITQSTTDMGGSYYSWDRDTGLFVTYPAAVTSELFRISAV